MNLKSCLHALFACIMILLGTGCATRPSHDYTAYKASRPHSILVLPPLNESPEVSATYSMLAQVTRPLAEAGYYVMPVTLVAEEFKENGLTQPAEMHATATQNLRQTFGADAALYIRISRYGTVYQLISSETVVAADAKLVDLKSGNTLWQGSARASSAEGRNQQGGIAGMLIAAVVNQILETVLDESHKIAGITAHRLLGTR